MATYKKEKKKQYIINSAKCFPYFIKNGVLILNLNSCFIKYGNYVKLISILEECKEFNLPINLCNLASFCYRFGIPYNSQETITFVTKVIELIKCKIGCPVIQKNMENCWETDLKPVNKLIKYDRQHFIVYVSNILLQCLDILGFVEIQAFDLAQLTKNMSNIIPEDLLLQLPLENTKNNLFYEQELLPLFDKELE